MRSVSPLLLLLLLGATAASFWFPDAKNFMEPALFRIIFFHLPSAFLTLIFLFLSAYMGVRYLSTRDVAWDHRNAATLELGTWFGIFTMTTGILFSRAQWGEWWHWDPRQTSFLFVLMILGVGLALRAGHGGNERKAAASAAYSVISLLPALFLILVFPRLPQVQRVSLHPSNTISGGQMDKMYWYGILAVFAGLSWLSMILYSMRVRMMALESELDNCNGNLENGLDGAAPHRVVRPVSLSEEHVTTAGSGRGVGAPD